MSHLRSLAATLLSAATTFSLVTASSCGTNAVGVSDCRDIEQARCRAGQPCGIVEDVPACERYYRDHCLHGLATKPEAGSVAACVQVIQAAGRCAQNDPESTLAACAETETVTVTAPRQGFSTACDVVAHPEHASECAFLLDKPEEIPASGGAGGQGSSEEPTSGTAGQSSGAAGETAQGGVAAQ